MCRYEYANLHSTLRRATTAISVHRTDAFCDNLGLHSLIRSVHLKRGPFITVTHGFSVPTGIMYWVNLGYEVLNHGGLVTSRAYLAKPLT